MRHSAVIRPVKQEWNSPYWMWDGGSSAQEGVWEEEMARNISTSTKGNVTNPEGRSLQNGWSQKQGEFSQWQLK